MKKEIKENGAVKSTKPCRMKFFKRVMSVISVVALTAAMFVGAAFTFTGCSKEPAPDNPPSIVQPVPDDPEEGETEQPGGDENEGEQGGTEQPGETDPEEGETEQPGETDPGESEEGNEGETPDPGVTDPDNPGGTIPTPDPEPEVPVIDSLDDLEMEEPNPEDYETQEALEEAQAKYEAAQEAKKVIGNTLHDNLYEELIYRTVGSDYDLSKVEDEKWEVVDEDNDGNIDTIKLRYYYNVSDTAKAYQISSVTPAIENLTLSDLNTNSPDLSKLEDAFAAGRGGAAYRTEYNFSYNPTIQEERAELLDAVNKKLAADGVISAVDANTQSFIRDNGSTVDSGVNGTARRIVVMNLTENGYEEVSIRIKEDQSTYSDEALIENLNNGDYYEIEADAEKGTFTGTVLENVDLPQQETEVASYSLVYTNEKGETEEYELDL